MFQNCILQARLGKASSQNIYTASGRTDPGQNTGLSFLSCRVGAAPGLPDSYPTYLGRPWKPYAQTVFIKSTLAKCVNPAGRLLIYSLCFFYINQLRIFFKLWPWLENQSILCFSIIFQISSIYDYTKRCNRFSLNHTAGWLLWNGDPNSGKTVTYGEYGNTGPGANTASRVKWSRQISVAEATKFTVSSFIAGQEWLPATSIVFNNAL